MKTIAEQITNENGIHLHIVPNKKFKTITIAAKFKAPLARDIITMRALIPYVLQQGTKTYPNSSLLQKKLDDLYGAVLSIDGAKKGNNHIITVRMEIANQKFIQDESSLFEEAIALFQEIIFEPNVQAGAFDEKIVAREKETLKQRIHAIMDDKMSYANMRLIDEMCQDEAYRLHVHGYVEDMDSVTAANLYTYYEELLDKNRMDVYVLGDFDSEKAKEKMKIIFARKKSLNLSVTDERSMVKGAVRTVVEEQDIQQAKLHLGYRTNTIYKDDDYAALHVFNGIFGGFPSSKLFVNVREKNSLAYYASSRIESHKGLMLVFSGIAPEDYEKAREIIELQLDAMKRGDFTNEEVEETKDLIINQLLETMDNPTGLIELLYQQVVGEKMLPPEQLIAGIKQVGKEEVARIAGKVVEDTVFLLTRKGAAPNEGTSV